jgi:hypothetical protein
MSNKQPPNIHRFKSPALTINWIVSPGWDRAKKAIEKLCLSVSKAEANKMSALRELEQSVNDWRDNHKCIPATITVNRTKYYELIADKECWRYMGLNPYNDNKPDTFMGIDLLISDQIGVVIK